MAGSNTDELYIKAKSLLDQNPQIGKRNLATSLHCSLRKARKFIARHSRETKRWSPEQEMEVVKRVAATTYRDVAREYGVSRGKIYAAVKKHRALFDEELAKLDKGPSPQSGIKEKLENENLQPGEFKQEVTQNEQNVAYLGKQIHTLPELLKFAEIGDEWVVGKFVENKWDIGAKGPTGEIVTSPLYQVKAWLYRKVANIVDVLKSMWATFREEAPVRPARAYPKPQGGGLLELALFDAHYGRACWVAETGANYNLDIADELYITGLEALLERATVNKISRILYPIGNDFFNVDNADGTTTKGTRQDESCGARESFLRGRQLQVRAIERLLEIAPVDVIVIWGNHDTHRIYYLGDALECRFFKTRNVTINNAPTDRKFYHWDRVLFGFTHGNKEKHTDLPHIMATAKKQDWANSDYYEWQIGHWHARKCKFFIPCQDQRGVLVRVLPSLCPADAWTVAMGYQSQREAQAFFYEPGNGCVAEYTYTVQKNNREQEK